MIGITQAATLLAGMDNPGAAVGISVQDQRKIIHTLRSLKEIGGLRAPPALRPRNSRFAI